MIRYASSRSTRRLCLFGSLLLGWSGQVLAFELNEALQVHGFLSQAAALTNRNNVGGNSSDGWAFELRELGANVSWRPDPDWLLSAQGLMRWAGRTDDGDLRLDYGFVDRTLLTGDNRLGIQLGKIKNSYGLYNTTRDVAHTRPGILMPQSIYWDRIRDFMLAAPGVSLYGEHNGPLGTLNWQASVLKPEVSATEVEYVNFLMDMPGRLKGRTSWLGQAMLELDHERWRLGVSLGDMAMRYAPAGIDPLQPGTTHYRPIVLSLEHNRETWTFAAEYTEIAVKYRDHGPMFILSDNTTQAYYVQATWRFEPRWQAYARYDALYVSKGDRRGKQFEALTAAAGMPLPGHLLYAEDITVGLRHDPTPGWSLSLEAHRVRGAAGLARVDHLPGLPEKGWNLLLLQAAYRF